MSNIIKLREETLYDACEKFIEHLREEHGCAAIMVIAKNDDGVAIVDDGDHLTLNYYLDIAKINLLADTYDSLQFEED